MNNNRKDSPNGKENSQDQEQNQENIADFM